MEDQCTDCPCKKQRVSDSENDSPDAADGDIAGSTNDGAVNILPNSDHEEEQEGISMCSGGLLDCLTEAYSIPSCSDTVEQRSQQTSLIADVRPGASTYPSQKVRHDIAQVVQDTMAALAENTYIRNKEAELQSQNFATVQQFNTSSNRVAYAESPCTLTDTGFISLFSNCRDPKVSCDSNDDNEALLQTSEDEEKCENYGDKCESGSKCEASDMGSICEMGAAGDASSVTRRVKIIQQSSSSSSESSPRHDIGAGSSILDNFFKYIPCGISSRQELPCRPSNTPFQLDIGYIKAITSRNNVNSLPSQMLVHIFRFLSLCTLLRKVSLVCKYWYNLARDQDLWKNINLMNQHKLTDIYLQQLISFSDRVTNVNLTDCRFVTNVGVKVLLARCKHLQILKLMRCFDLTDDAFTEVLDKNLCSQLRCLRLDGCCRITDASIIKIAKACQYLQVLHINQCTKITDSSIKVLAECCHRLTHLLMDHCSQVTEEGLEAIVMGCPYISYLNIMSCGVTDRGVKLLSKLTNLSNVDLSNIPRLTPEAVVYLSHHCKNLECINICLNSVMNDECVTQLAKNLPKLRRLYCVSCNISDRGLEQIATYRPDLEALDVGWCQDITDHGVRVISHACKNLDYFGLIRCDQVSVETVEELVLQFPRVNYSTFVLESRRLLERAQREGFMFSLS